MQKSLIAALVALPLLAFAPPSAKAGGVDIGVGIGIGDPDYYGPGPGYFDDDYEYRPRRYYRDRPRRFGRLSCGEARRLVRRNGFRNVSARDCSGGTYSFNATRRGVRVRVYVDARSGAVWRG